MTAAILILITLCQLMLTPSASILNEVLNDVTLLKNELNTFMAQDGNTTEMSASGEFVRPPKVDTTIIKNKLHELQNNITKLAEAILNKNQNVDDIKNRISILEREIENLNKLYDDKDREITQNLEKLQNILSDLMAKYKNREQELAKLQYEEFLGAIKHRYYKFAAVKFVTMKNETNAINLISSVYEEIGDLPPILEFADKVDDLKRKLLIYRTTANSNTFLHCLGCNIILTCNKLLEIPDSNEITGELKEIYSNSFDLLKYFAMSSEFRNCIRTSKKKYPGRVKFLVERYCLSDDRSGKLAQSGVHDYSGYCYPIDSIYNILK